MLIWPPKNDNETLAYKVDWSARLDDAQIIESQFQIIAGSVTIASQNHTETESTITLSGGIPGETAVLVVTITTTEGEIITDNVMLPIAGEWSAFVVAFKTRFPEFMPVSSTLIDMIADEGRERVRAFRIADQEPALMYLVAHILTLEGEPGRSTGATSVGAAMGSLTSYKVGDVAATFATIGSGAGDDGWWGRSAYGQAFLGYLRRNVTPFVMVV